MIHGPADNLRTPARDSKGPAVWPTGLFIVVGVTATILLAIDGGLIRRLVWLVTGVVATWLAILAWRAPGRSGGLVALVFGCVGVVVGVGIGVRWLGVGAVELRTVLSLLALLPGLALVGLGIARMTHAWRMVVRSAAVLGLVMVFALVVWTLTPAVIATNVPPLPHGEVTPAEFGLAAREVSYPADDGTELWAWYVEASNEAVVVLRHGSGSTAEDVLGHADLLVDHGYGVLVTDARGHGRSGGDAMDFGWYGTSDIQAAIDFVIEQPGVDPGRIVVVGMSMGGEEAIGAAGEDDRIAAVVAEGATARTEADKTWLIGEYGWRGRIQVGLEWLQYSFTELLTDAGKPVDLASSAELAAPRPILMITAGEVPDERNAAEHIQAEAGENVSIWTVPGAVHIDGLETARDGWERTVTEFLDSALNGS